MKVTTIISTTIHDVNAVAISQLKSLGHVVDRMSYYRVLKVRTEGGGGFELTLFSTCLLYTSHRPVPVASHHPLSSARPDRLDNRLHIRPEEGETL